MGGSVLVALLPLLCFLGFPGTRSPPPGASGLLLPFRVLGVLVFSVFAFGRARARCKREWGQKPAAAARPPAQEGAVDRLLQPNINSRQEVVVGSRALPAWFECARCCGGILKVTRPACGFIANTHTTPHAQTHAHASTQTGGASSSVMVAMATAVAWTHDGPQRRRRRPRPSSSAAAFLLLMLVTAATAVASDSSTTTTGGGGGGGSGGGSSVKLMLESVKEIASCPGALPRTVVGLGIWHACTPTAANDHPHRLLLPSLHPSLPNRLLPALHALEPLPRHHGLRRPLRPRTGARVVDSVCVWLID